VRTHQQQLDPVPPCAAAACPQRLQQRLAQHCLMPGLLLLQGGALDTVSKGETVVLVRGSTEIKLESPLDAEHVS